MGNCRDRRRGRSKGRKRESLKSRERQKTHSTLGSSFSSVGEDGQAALASASVRYLLRLRRDAKSSLRLSELVEKRDISRETRKLSGR